MRQGSQPAAREKQYVSFAVAGGILLAALHILS